MPLQPHRQVRRARLILDGARALPRAFLLIPLLLCLGTLPARAGSWTFTCTGSGLLTYVPYQAGDPINPVTWTPPGPQTGSFSLPQFGGDAWPNYHGDASASATITLQVQATWSAAAGQTAATDPPPPSVWLCEAARTEWTSWGHPSTGKCSDGLGPEDAETGTSGMADSPTAPRTTPPAYWTKVSVVNGVATLPQRTLSAKGSANPGDRGGDCFTLQIDSYTVNVHAQPYNFRASGYTAGDGTHRNKAVQDNPNATLALSYVWDSTDGNKSDLTSCTISENVTWDSNPTGVGQLVTNTDGTKYYVLPSPPAGKDAQGHSLAYLDPTVTSKPATDPGITDTFSPDSVYAGPYTNIAWWGDQKYVFSDSATGETATPLPGPAAGTFRITRTVARIGTSNSYGLTISTRGYQAGPMILP